MKYFLSFLFTINTLVSVISFANENLKVASIVEPPFSRIENDTLVGFNVDVAEMLASSINLKPVIIQCPFARCLTMLEQGSADLMINLKKLPEREKNLIFIEPPLFVQDQPIRFYTLSNNNININKLTDLLPLVVGTIRGAAYFPEFDNNTKIRKVDFTTREQLVNMLLKGRIDTFLEREESIEPLISSQEYKDKMTIESYQYNKPVGSYIAISRNSSISKKAHELSIQVNKLIKTQVINQLQAQHLPSEALKPTLKK